ncbi:hypothetical protein CRG98_049191, partial [Punica granatum]
RAGRSGAEGPAESVSPELELREPRIEELCASFRVAGIGELWASSSNCRDRGAVGVVIELPGSGSCGRRH